MSNNTNPKNPKIIIVTVVTLIALLAIVFFNFRIKNPSINPYQDAPENQVFSSSSNSQNSSTASSVAKLSLTNTSQNFPGFGITVNYPEEFKIENKLEEKSIDTMGKVINEEFLILDFENDILRFDLIDENVKVSFQRFTYHPDYEPISPSGGGNLEINSIVCYLPLPCGDYIKFSNLSIYRQEATIDDNIYNYATGIKNNNESQHLTTYIRFLKLQNDYDGITVGVEFTNLDLSLEAKKDYLEAVDKIILGLTR